MDAEKIRQLLIAELPQCDISVDGGDGKYLVNAVGAVFEGLNAVKRQQLVYKILGEHISSGAIHAISMNLQTEAERGTA